MAVLSLVRFIFICFIVACSMEKKVSGVCNDYSLYSDGLMFECNDGGCILNDWVCDGLPDCSDGGDEANCVCDPNTQFQCENGGCIRADWECDGQPDCQDDSDETGSNCTTSCGLDADFLCHNGGCTEFSRVCDGWPDCTDASDEADCDYLDCFDDSDEDIGEENCAECSFAAFQCANGKCIPETWRCNTYDDCGDNSDEMDGCECDEVNEFECDGGACIPNGWLCDGFVDCYDESDERLCRRNQSTTLTEYELRLTDVNHPYNLQRLEVRQRDGEWGTLCCSKYCNNVETSFPKDLEYICHFLGYDRLLGYSNDYESVLNSSTLPVHLSLDNNTRESDVAYTLDDLIINNWSQPTCNSSNNVFLICTTDNDDFKWRLVNTFSANITTRGRLEVRRNREKWGPVCLDMMYTELKLDKTKEFCKENLGLTTDVPLLWERPFVGDAIYNSLMEKPGGISALDTPYWSIPTWGNVKCPKQYIIYLSCDDAFSTEVGEWRLVDGSNVLRGRLEFRFKEESTWHSISASGIRPSVLDKICKHLGNGTFLTFYESWKFGAGNGTLYLLGDNNITRETSIVEDHTHDVGLQCITNETISTKLLGNPLEKAIVQVWNGSSWGKICVNSWNLDYAELVCQDAGYTHAMQALSIPIDEFHDNVTDVYLNLKPSFDCNDGHFSASIACRDKMTESCECQTYYAGVKCSTLDDIQLDLDVISDMLAVPLYDTSLQLHRLQTRVDDLWYPLCDDRSPWSLALEYFQHVSDAEPYDVCREGVITYGNSSHIAIRMKKHLTIRQGNCSTYGLNEAIHFCGRVIWEEFFGHGDIYVAEHFTSCEGRCNHERTGSCRCDSECVEFGDCCFDYDTVCNESTTSILSKPEIDSDLFGCHEFILDDIHLIDKCPSLWKEGSIRQLCTSRLNSMPMYDQYGYNLRNIFCAICNNRKLHEIHPWNMIPYTTRECHLPLPEGGKFLDLINNEGQEFVTGNRLRFCYQQLQCLSTTETEIAEKCNSALVFPTHCSGFVYKNPFCHRCLENIETTSPEEEGFECESSGLQRMWEFRKPKPAKQEVLQECAPNEIRDPVTQVCHQVSCRPGYSPSITSTECVLDSDKNLLAVNNWKCPNQYMKLLTKGPSTMRDDTMFCLKDYMNGYKHLIDNEYILRASEDLDWRALEMNNLSNGFEIVRFLENKIQLKSIFNTPDDDLEELFCGITELEVLLTCDELLSDELNINCNAGDWYIGTPSDFIIANENPDMTSILYVPKDVYITPTYVIFYGFYQRGQRQIDKKNLVFICGDKIKSFSLDCAFIVLNVSKYTLINNGTTLLDSAKQLQSREFIVTPTGEARVCFDSIDPYRDSDVKRNQFFIAPLQIIGFVITPMSLSGLLGTLTTYVKFKQLRNTYGHSVMGLSVALLHAQLLTLLTDAVPFSGASCVVFAAMKHYFWLATFTWTTIMGFVLFFQFGRQKIQKVTKSLKTSLFLQVVGWVMPLFMSATVLAVHLALVFSGEYGVFGGSSCWIVAGLVNLVAFGIPVIISLFVNIILVAATLIQLRKARHRSNRLQHKDENSNKWREVILFGKVSSVLGFSWILMFIASAADVEVLWWIAIIASSLQGVHIFFSFGFNEKARQLWKDSRSK